MAPTRGCSTLLGHVKLLGRRWLTCGLMANAFRGPDGRWIDGDIDQAISGGERLCESGWEDGELPIEMVIAFRVEIWGMA